MSSLDHPHITRLEEVYEDDDKVYFILELAKVRPVLHEHKKLIPFFASGKKMEQFITVGPFF
jgi:serine/threonine protein kinase